MSAPAAIGVDLGGTKMLAGVVGGDGAIIDQTRFSSQGRTQDELVDLLAEQLGAMVESHSEVRAVGLGVPCTIDRERGICVNAVNLPLSNLPLAGLLSERLSVPVSLDNDGNVAALAEHRHGVAVGATNVVLLTIGTGIGGGLIIGGELFRGSTGAGAELGHVVIEADGPRCQGSCPNRGCVEALASGTALAREGTAAAERHPGGALAAALRERGSVDGEAILEAAEAGDRAASDVFDLLGRRLGVALSSLANSFDPDVIVIGGGVMAAGERLLVPARDELRARALPPQNQVPVRAAALGPEAGMIGAATLALEEAA